MSGAETHAGAACLLLGLGDAHSSSHSQQPASMPVGAAAAGSETRLNPETGPTTPAAVAAALLSALPPTDRAVNSMGRPALTAAEAAKQRRPQVSSLPRKEWSAEEDALIRNGVEQLGCRWRVIAAQLPGRSDDAVRNRWSRLQESLKGTTQAKRTAGTGAGATAGSGAKAGGSGEAGGSRAGATAAATAAALAAADGGGGGPGGPGGAGGGSGAGGGAGGGGGTGGGGDGENGAPKPGRGSKGGGRKGEGGGSSDGAPAEKKERTSWTRAEDDVIVQGVAELGHKWYEIARRLPGRTDHAIRNRWSRLQSIIGMQDALHASPLSLPTAVEAKGMLDLSRSHGASPLMPPTAAPMPPPTAHSVLAPLSEPPPGAASLLGGVRPRAGAQPSVSSLSAAALATVCTKPKGSGGGFDANKSKESTSGTDITSGASASEASDAELTNGTAELLLLQSGGASCGASCVTSPQIVATASSSEEVADAHNVGGLVAGSAADLLLLNKRPRV